MFILTTLIQHSTEILLITMKQGKEIRNIKIEKKVNFHLYKKQDFLCRKSQIIYRRAPSIYKWVYQDHKIQYEHNKINTISVYY